MTHSLGNLLLVAASIGDQLCPKLSLKRSRPVLGKCLYINIPGKFVDCLDLLLHLFLCGYLSLSLWSQLDPATWLRLLGPRLFLTTTPVP